MSTREMNEANMTLHGFVIEFKKVEFKKVDDTHFKIDYITDHAYVK